ncbi:hypothetical protein [Saliphagus sp. LR7]|uniref:hypothetical protein n=1 Tax=Saliphagus sp. LR7 TaxID=2282654 RepID=UPI0018E57A4B|nr:hypothetical protein [Saliphagus sp. LR7]
MATDTLREGVYGSMSATWGAGAAGGLVGGIGMGIVLHLGANMMPLIGTLYGWPTVLGGWLGHLINSVLLGLVFAALVSRWRIHDRISNVGEWAITGVLYAVAIGLVTGGIMLPITVNLMGTTDLPEPLLPVPGFVGGLLVAFSAGVAHLVYGLLLGTIYGRVHTRAVARRP